MSSNQSRFVLALAPPVLLAAFGFYWFSDTIADPDLWGHLRFGQDLLRSGSIPLADAYSYRTQGQEWINHEWLSEAAFAAVHDRWGTRGLIVLKCLIGLLLLGLGYAHLRSRRLGRWPSVFLLLVLCIPFRLGLGSVRPQMFTYLMFLALLILLENAVTGYEVRLWSLPILFAAWTNLHGGVLAGIGVLGLWIVVRTIGRLRDAALRPARRLGGIAAIGLLGCSCGLALLVNPYGGRLPQFLLRTATVPRPEISEWVPLGLLSFPGKLFLLLLLLAISSMALSPRRKPESTLILGVTAILPLLSSRHYPLFAFSLVAQAGEPIADLWNRCRPTWLARCGESRFLAVTGLIASLILIGLELPRLRCIRIEPFYFPFPARAVALLKRGDASGNMAVPFAWGEYVIWHLGPEVKVSNDGRRETVYSDECYRQSLDLERGTGVWDAVLKDSPTDLVLAQNGSPTANLMNLTKGWLPVYLDSVSVLFARESFPGLGRLVKTPVPDLPDDGAGLCFPAPDRY